MSNFLFVGFLLYVLLNFIDSFSISYALTDIDLENFSPWLEFLCLPKLEVSGDASPYGNEMASVSLQKPFVVSDFLCIIGTNLDTFVINQRDIKILESSPETFRPLLREIKKIQIQGLNAFFDNMITFPVIKIFSLLDPLKFQAMAISSSRFNTLSFSILLQCLSGTHLSMCPQINLQSDEDEMKELATSSDPLNAVEREKYLRPSQPISFGATNCDGFRAGNGMDSCCSSLSASSSNNDSSSFDSICSSASSSSSCSPIPSLVTTSPRPSADVSLDEAFNFSSNLENLIIPSIKTVINEFNELSNNSLNCGKENPFEKDMAPDMLEFRKHLLHYSLVSHLTKFELLHCDLSRELCLLLCDVLKHWKSLKSFTFNPNTTLSDSYIGDKLIETLKSGCKCLEHLQFQDTCVSFISLQSLLWHSKEDCKSWNSSDYSFSLKEYELLDCNIAQFYSKCSCEHEKAFADTIGREDMVSSCFDEVGQEDHFCWKMDHCSSLLCACNWDNLKKLDLSFNYWLEDSGVQALCLALEENSSLLALLLTDSGIGIDGLKSVFIMATGKFDLLFFNIVSVLDYCCLLLEFLVYSLRVRIVTIIIRLCKASRLQVIAVHESLAVTVAHMKTGQISLICLKMSSMHGIVNVE